MKSKDLKIAICFRGLASGVSKNVSVKGFTGWESIKEHVIQDHQYDVFAHSWSVDVKDRILEVYNPALSIIEDQKIFKKGYDPKLQIRKDNKEEWVEQIIKSNLYSLSKSISLKNKYEKDNKIKYDLVWILRYDMTFTRDIQYDKIEKNKIYYSKPLHNTRLPNFKKMIWDHFWVADSDTSRILEKSYGALATSGKNYKNIHYWYDDYFHDLGLTGDDVLSYTPENSVASYYINQKK